MQLRFCETECCFYCDEGLVNFVVLLDNTLDIYTRRHKCTYAYNITSVLNNTPM